MQFRAALDGWVKDGKMTARASEMWLKRGRDTPDIESLNRVIGDAKKAARV